MGPNLLLNIYTIFRIAPEQTQFSEQKKKDISKCKEAINRWTDNIFSVQSWCKNKFGIETKAMCQNFGIPEELDYLD